MCKSITIGLLAVSLCLPAGCGRREASSQPLQSRMEGGDIDLSHAITHKEKIRLSEIADSVSFIPLETTEESMLGGTFRLSFYAEYIFAQSYCFEWNGNFVKRIGFKGNGPYEEAYGAFNVLYKNGYYYSFGRKFIEYDHTGKPTGKVRNLYNEKDLMDGTHSLDSYYDRMVNGTTFFWAGDNFMVYIYPDQVVFLDNNFEIVGVRNVSKPVRATRYMQSREGRTGRFATDYNGTTLFYNFFNDTLFQVQNDKELVPKWTVHINPELKLSDDYFFRAYELLDEAANAYLNGSLEDAETIKLSDNRQMAVAAYETDRYLFFTMKNIIEYAELRKIKPPVPYIVFLDKETGEISSTEDGGFVDDILGLENFLPEWGAFDNKLIATIWPHELYSIMEESGNDVNPQLAALAKRVKVEDNPILLVAHLKR